MQLFYEKTNITKDVDVISCIHRDTAGNKCDLTEITLENAAVWFRWQPQRNDNIEVKLNGYTTGKMYLHSIFPENGQYRILATSVPTYANRKTTQLYQKKTLQTILNLCAVQCNMQCALYGINGDQEYSILREQESAPAFLQRLITLEGGKLKAYNGRLIGIGIAYAQEMNALQKIQISAKQEGVTYLRMDNKKRSSIRLITPYADATAVDTGAGDSMDETCTHYPALSNLQAGRWARGLLLNQNIAAEEITIDTEFNPGFTALDRVDIESETEMAGHWLMKEAVHDFVNKRSQAIMNRCISTI